MKKLLLVAVALAGLAATPAAAIPPQQEPTSNSEVALPAGLACEFPLTIGVVLDRHTTKTFFNKSGEPIRVQIGGPLIISLTNADTGDSMDVRLSGKLTLDLRSDEVTLTGTGRIFVALFPTDFPPGPSSTITSGRQVISIDEDGAFHLLSRVGKVVDVCEELA